MLIRRGSRLDLRGLEVQADVLDAFGSGYAAFCDSVLKTKPSFSVLRSAWIIESS